jgi:fructose-specific phosphotransferase system component IIB
MEEISYANPNSSNGKRISKRLLVFGGLFIIVLILLGSAVYFITQDKSPQEDEVTKSITLPADQEATPTPEVKEENTDEISNEPSEALSPTASENKSDISISVQNGSGVTGAAGKAADILKADGYTIASTTNADSSDYTDVTIQIKNSLKTKLSSIEKALSKDYTIGSTSADLPESTSYDVLVIIGS